VGHATIPRRVISSDARRARLRFTGGIGETESLPPAAIVLAHRDRPKKNPVTVDFCVRKFIFRSPSTTATRGGAMLTIVVCTATANR
jgi:hypothetical protein